MSATDKLILQNDYSLMRPHFFYVALISSAVQSALSAGLLTNAGPGSGSSSEQPMGASKKVYTNREFYFRSS